MMYFKTLRTLSLAVAAALALSACGGSVSDKQDKDTAAPAAPTADSASQGNAGIIESTKTLFGGQEPSSIRETPIEGLMEVVATGDVFYASRDGKYFMRADIIEVATRKSLTEEARAIPRREAIKDVDEKDAITFQAKGEEKFEIYVFTDTDCGFCRKLHGEIRDYTSRGITVHYFPWPRSGAQGSTYETMVSVWCAKDQQKAITDAKAGRSVKPATCENPVERYYGIGQRMMISGTPAIFTPDGEQFGGYVSAAELLPRLEAAAAKQQAAEEPAATE